MANLSEMIHGRKPDIAPFKSTDPIEMLHKLLAGEATNWPDISKLGSLYQAYMLSNLENVVPGFSDMLKQGGIDTEMLLKSVEPLVQGQIPQDLSDEVMRHAAFTSLGAGTLGGPMGMALSARDLGLTGLDVMKQGAGLLDSGTNAAQRWQQIASGTILPPSSQLYSPEWFAEFDAKQKAAAQATKQLKFNRDAAPDPAMAQRAAMLASLLGSFAGPGGSSMGSAISSGVNGVNYGGTNQGQQYNTQANPGFLSNIGTAYSGGQSTGIGGWLGSVLPGHGTPTYMGGMPSDVSGANPPVTVQSSPFLDTTPYQWNNTAVPPTSSVFNIGG
jgi:hypothetical protein